MSSTVLGKRAERPDVTAGDDDETGRSIGAGAGAGAGGASKPCIHPVSDDPRMGTLQVDDTATAEDGAAVVVRLIQFPFDEGCVRNGGRAGAKDGPDAVMRFLPKMGCVDNTEFGVNLADAGIRYSLAGVAAGDTLEAAHSCLEELVYAALGHGSPVFVVGGGNDQSFPNARALMRRVEEGLYGPPSAEGASGSQVSVVNIDAHFDVRPLKDGKVHSGSPFRLMMEDPLWSKLSGSFTEFAAQGSQCSAEHTRYLESKGADIVWLRSILGFRGTALSATESTAPTPDDSAPRLLAFATATPGGASFYQLMQRTGGRKFVSFDIDSIASSDCPGVSCPATVGLSALDALAISYLAGSMPDVVLMDVSELNPRFDDYRSPRLVVNMFYYFLLGLATRRSKST